MKNQLDEIIDAQSFDFWLKHLGWQGGTIHAVHKHINERYVSFNWLKPKEARQIAKGWGLKQCPRQGREILHVPARCHDSRCNKTIVLGKGFDGNFYIAMLNPGGNPCRNPSSKGWGG